MDRSYLGIDIAKKTFDAALLQGDAIKAKTFDNNPAGFKKLATWLKTHAAGELFACMEATGAYGDDLAHFLHEAGHSVCVVNPLQPKAFAESELQRISNDKTCAAVIARFARARAQELTLWSPPSPEYRALKELQRRIDDLIEARTQELNRLKSCRDSSAAIKSIKAHIEFLDAQIQQLDAETKNRIDHDPDVKKKQQLLTSIPGIGNRTAAILLAELDGFTRYENVRQLAADVGVIPLNRDSGESVHYRPRMCKIGNAKVRKALYMPALCAIGKNPIVRDIYLRLTLAGKARMAAVGAAMRKLLALAFGVLKSGKPFDPNYRPEFHYS